MGGLLVAFLDGQYNAAAFKAGDAAGASSTAPGCRYYVQSGECARPPGWLAGSALALSSLPAAAAAAAGYLLLHGSRANWIEFPDACPALPCPTPCRC